MHQVQVLYHVSFMRGTKKTITTDVALRVKSVVYPYALVTDEPRTVLHETETACTLGMSHRYHWCTFAVMFHRGVIKDEFDCKKLSVALFVQSKIIQWVED